MLRNILFTISLFVATAIVAPGAHAQQGLDSAIRAVDKTIDDWARAMEFPMPTTSITLVAVEAQHLHRLVDALQERVEEQRTRCDDDDFICGGETLELVVRLAMLHGDISTIATMRVASIRALRLAL